MTAADDDDKGKGKEMVEDEEEEEKFAESMIMEKIEVAYVGGAELAEENIVVDVVEDALANGGTSTTPGDHEDADVASCSGGANVGDEGDDGIVDGDGGEGGNDDNNDDEENLDDLLENLDIDGDFECWESMKKGTSGENENEGEEQGAATSKSAVDSPTDENIAGKNVGDNNDAAAASDESRPPSPSTVLQQNLQKWKDRLEREEVYSRLYRPSSAERSELQELETHLDMNPKRGLRTLFVRTNSTGGGRNVSPANRMAWNLLLHPEDQQQQQQNQETAAPAATATVNHSFPSSILLKRGPVSFGEQGNNEQALVDGEAILLTRGFVLAKKMATDAGSSSKKNVASSHSSLHRAILWQNVTFVEPVAGDDMSWTLTIQKNSSNDTVGAGATAGGATIRTRTTSSGGGSASSDDQDDHSANNNCNSNNNSEHHDDNNFHNTIAQQQEITFVCDSLAERDAWLEAMERVLIPHHLHNSNNNQNATGTSSSLISVTELGWQYKLVHRPAFTMAVTGMVADMVLPPPEVLDKLDKYNELTALHVSIFLLFLHVLLSCRRCFVYKRRN
jgi:hypothetical protein